jgi:hypothetical protein
MQVRGMNGPVGIRLEACSKTSHRPIERFTPAQWRCSLGDKLDPIHPLFIPSAMDVDSLRKNGYTTSQGKGVNQD